MSTADEILKVGVKAWMHLEAEELRENGEPRMAALLQTGAKIWIAYEVGKKVSQLVKWFNTPKEYKYELYWRHQCRHPIDIDGDEDTSRWKPEDGELPIGHYRTLIRDHTVELQAFLDDLPGSEDILCLKR